METSDVMTTEDIDKLDSVIQLNPHKKAVEYTTVGKSEDDDLISVDELYEKTGQENIERILAGLESLLKYNKLTRDQGLLLKVQGAESWLELPDRMNAIKGGEGFISSFVNGFFDIIRAIIKFVKGICVWIYRRIMSLFGFEKSKEEKMFIYHKEKEAKKAVVTLYKSLGIDADYEKLAADLKSVKSTKEARANPDYNPQNTLLADINKASKESKDIIRRIPDILKEIEEFKKVIAVSTKDIEIANNRYKKIILELKNGLRKNTIELGAISDIKYQLVQIAKEQLNPNNFLTLAEKLLVSIGNFKAPTSLGLSDRLNNIRKQANEDISNIRVAYNEELYDDLSKGADEYYSKTRNNNKMNDTGIKLLSNILNDKDADVIAGIAQLVKNNDLTVAYTSFSENVKTYSSAIEITAKIVQQVEAALQKIVDGHVKLEMATTAILAKDATALLDKKLNLSTADYKQLFEGDNPLFSFKSINTQFIKAHPDAKTSKTIGMVAQAYAKSPEGKKVQDAARTYITSFQRKR